MFDRTGSNSSVAWSFVTANKRLYNGRLPPPTLQLYGLKK